MNTQTTGGIKIVYDKDGETITFLDNDACHTISTEHVVVKFNKEQLESFDIGESITIENKKFTKTAENVLNVQTVSL